MATETVSAEERSRAGEEHAEHPPHLKHWFVSSEQQFNSAKLGMWLFLITEILLFSGLFVAYAVYRVWQPEAFDLASSRLDWVLGGVNTVVLLTSSLTVALSIHYVQMNKRMQMVYSLLGTVALAFVFMVVKYFEYTDKFAHGIYPAGWFEPHGEYYAILGEVAFTEQFYSIYYVMTGIHGFHVLVGIGVIGWITYRGWKGHFSSDYYTPVELTGLYWHLVDIIWIFLFPMLYLI